MGTGRGGGAGRENRGGTLGGGAGWAWNWVWWGRAGVRRCALGLVGHRRRRVGTEARHHASPKGYHQVRNNHAPPSVNTLGHSRRTSIASPSLPFHRLHPAPPGCQAGRHSIHQYYTNGLRHSGKPLISSMHASPSLTSTAYPTRRASSWTMQHRCWRTRRTWRR